MLRDQRKVADLGPWVTNHPAAASEFGLPAACRSTTYKADQSVAAAGFGNVHIGRKEAPAGNVELYVVYLTAASAGVRIDAPKPAASISSF